MVRDKIVRGFMACALAVSLCLAPFAQTAYAWVQLAIPAGQALAAVLAVLGVSVVIDGDDAAKALWYAFEHYTDDLDALGSQVSAMQDAAIELGQANGQLVNATKQQVSAQEVDAIKDVFAAAGQAGTFALDQLSMLSSAGVLGILPFLLSGFVSQQTSLPVVDTPILWGSIALPMSSMGVSAKSHDGSDFVPQVVDSSGVMFGYVSVPQVDNAAVIYGTSRNAKVVPLRAAGDIFTGANYLMYYTGNRKPTITSTTFIYSGSLYNDFVGINADIPWRVYDTSVGDYVAYYDPVTGWSGTAVTDNPDVNLGHDWWDDARDRVDVLNPATGAAVIGSDAVIDGDYIANRGSIAIPTTSDWADINSWADALARTHAGVAEGTLEGTISTTTTGTAVNVGTGELVTDAVGELVKPDAGTSVSPSKDFDWGKFLDPSLYLVFPFCLPWDLVELVKTLSAEPQAPVIDWPMPTLTGGQQTLHVDLSPWSPVAAVLRTGELIVAAIGLIWITKTMIKV